MSTVGKAISLLELFTAKEPESGLSDLARKARFDKATTRRLLLSLAAHGFVEQDAYTRRYRLGEGLARLAHIREAHFPFLQIAMPIVRDIAQQSGETIHLSEFSAGALATVHVELSAKANRINVDVGQVLPLHGTASGIAFLAFSRPEIVDAYLSKELATFTLHTVVDRQDIREAMRATTMRGYSQSAQGYEEGVFSVAAPVLGAEGFAIGTLALAMPLTRVEETTPQRPGQAVTLAARQMGLRLNGEPFRPGLSKAS
jgi:DNA-binding IclR family transcriptional regulator